MCRVQVNYRAPHAQGLLKGNLALLGICSKEWSLEFRVYIKGLEFRLNLALHVPQKLLKSLGFRV